MPGGIAQDLNSNNNVRFMIYDVFVAPEDTVVDAASGWVYTGVCDPETFQPDFPVEEFNLERGIPRSNKVKAIIGAKGMATWKQDEISPNVIELSTNSGTGVRTYATAPAATTIAAGSPTASAWNLTLGTNYAAKQLIEVAGTDLTYLKSVVGAAVVVEPALPAAPTAGATIKAIKRIENVLGTSIMGRYAIKFVLTDIGGTKLTIYMAAVSFKKGFNIDIGGGVRNAQMPMSIEAYGKEGTWLGKSEQILGRVYVDYPGVT